MVQQNLLPHEVRNEAQPQTVAKRARTSQSQSNTNRRADEPRGRSAHFHKMPTIDSRRSDQNVADPEPRPAAPPSESVRLFGWIGRYFQVRQTQSGKSLATFSLATREPYKDPLGKWAKRTVWQRIVVWDETAQSVGERLRKGARVLVEGRFRTREWTDKENNLRTTTELVARHVRFLDAAEA
jgi:Single-strand binding protein family